MIIILITSFYALTNIYLIIKWHKKLFSKSFNYKYKKFKWLHSYRIDERDEYMFAKKEVIKTYLMLAFLYCLLVGFVCVFWVFYNVYKTN
jgi:hypothetical protein